MGAIADAHQSIARQVYAPFANLGPLAAPARAVEYIQANRARVLLMREFDKLMSQYDVLLSAGSDATLSTTNLTGHPAMAVKCGIVNNAPQMLMLTGRLYDEGTMARVALAFEQATEWKERHPKLAN